ncbi:MAG: hydrogen gas-evolving membrane-bound hydrogenase subunit E, partial [Opitutales bacterium]
LLWLLFLPAHPEPGATYMQQVSWFSTLGVSLDFFVDGLGRMMAILVCAIGALIMIYQRSYLEHGKQNGKFQAYLMLFMGAMVGITVADNIILMFVFWELTSISSYLLIGYYHEELSSRKKALQALLVTGSGGGAMLAGLTLIAADTSMWRFTELLANVDAVKDSAVCLPAFLLIALGALTKSAQFPFHFWLPNAMAAPTPVSAFLHSATMVKAGVFLLARVHPLFYELDAWTGILVSTGLLTMLLGGYAGFREADLKRVLAFTTLAVLGIITAFLGLGGKEAVKAALVFLVAHAFYKAALFMVAGNIDHGTGTRDVRYLRGLRHAMPWTAVAAAVAAFSKAGFPLLFGFIAKESVYEAGLHSPLDGFVAPLAVLGNALMVGLALIVGWHPFFTDHREAKLPHHPHEASWDMRLGPLVLAGLGLLFGMFPGLFGDWLVGPAVAAAYGHEAHVHLAIWHGFNLPLLLSAITVGLGLLMYVKRDAIWAAFEIGDEKPSMWEGLYNRCLDAFIAFSNFQTRLLQNGSLRRYFQMILAFLAFLLIYEFFTLGLVPRSIVFDGVGIYELTLGLLIALSTGFVMFSSSRFVGLIALGVIGFGVAILFVLHGAPDLALTQIVVETLTVVLFMLVIARLPNFKQFSKTSAMGRDLVLSIVGGMVVTVLVLKAQDVRLGASIADYFAKASYAEAHGKNVVNVILVDFRGLDTMGEITVLAIAAVGIYSLMRGDKKNPSDFSK